MKKPAPKSKKPPFASKEEQELFEAARRRFIEEGKLDTLRAFLTRGKSLSARIGEEIADMLNDRDKITIMHTTKSDLGYALVVQAFKDSRGRPHLIDTDERLSEAAEEIYDRVKAGEPREQTLRAVHKDYGLNLNELRAKVWELEDIYGELPRWPSKKKVTQHP